MAHADWRALGTSVRLVVHGGDLPVARAATEAVLEEVDLAFSRFRADLELMRLHAARGRPIGVSPLLARAIDGAMQAARRTGGAVDPTVGRAVRVIGYDADFALVGGGLGPLQLRVAPAPGWTAVSFDPAARIVRIPDGVEVDLGSTGKGLAADLAAEAAYRSVGPDAGILVSLGGDIATAGCAPPGGWRITVAEDSAVDPVATASGPRPLEVVAIWSGAVATSSTRVRRWRTAGGADVHHIVDPRTGLSAETPWRTVTVAAASCEEANAASTAAIVLGHEAHSWLTATGLPARLVGASGSVTRLNAWPEAA